MRPIRDTADHRAAALARARREAAEHRRAEQERQDARVVEELTRCVALGLGWHDIAPRLRARCGKGTL